MLYKDIRNLNVAVLVPCYKRPEYTEKCLKAIEDCHKPCKILFVLWDDGSCDNTKKLLDAVDIMPFPFHVPQVSEAWISPRKMVCSTRNHEGLRRVVVHFFNDPCLVKGWKIDILAKIDNDCVIPVDYFDIMLKKMIETDADILSPNVFPSDAAHKYGEPDKDGKLGYMPSNIVGGLWFMKLEMIKGIKFEFHEVLYGIKGATNILYQIVLEKDPKIGWVTDVVVQDIGHWTGEHPEHIISKKHAEYYKEIGREVAWAK